MRGRVLVLLMLSLSFGAISARSEVFPSIEGTITTEWGTGLSGVTVSADDRAWNMHASTTTDPSGHYTLENLTPGAYSLCAKAEGYGSIIVPRIIVGAGDTIKRDFRFTRIHQAATHFARHTP